MQTKNNPGHVRAPAARAWRGHYLAPQPLCYDVGVLRRLLWFGRLLYRLLPAVPHLAGSSSSASGGPQ